jgi:hypothetical protein
MEENDENLMGEGELQEHMIDDTSQDSLGNYHIEVPEEVQYLLDQFSTFYNKNENGGSSRWMVTPDTVKRWVIMFGELRFKAGKDDAFNRVVEIIGSNINEETREALTFLINENNN